MVNCHKTASFPYVYWRRPLDGDFDRRVLFSVSKTKEFSRQSYHGLNFMVDHYKTVRFLLCLLRKTVQLCKSITVKLKVLLLAIK